MVNTRKQDLRLDLKIIGDLIKPDTTVLDLGCGDGELLDYLVVSKGVSATGIEINEEEIYKCVEKGLSVSHSDIDSGLREYPDKMFDYVIFNQTMQQVHRPKEAISEALRVGTEVIIGFPNFCNLSARLQLFFGGHVPVTPSLPYTWYETPNLHFLSIKDFIKFCGEENIKIEKKFYISETGVVNIFPNLFALNAVFQISRN